MPVLLQKALDPPDPEFIEDALNLLVCMKALDRPSPRGRYEPTFYGRLLASFPLSFDASVLVLKFADFGLLQQGILLGILMDAQPQPILRPFGEEHLVLSYKLHVLACGNNSPSDNFFYQSSVYRVRLPILWWRLRLYCPNWSKGDDTNWKLGCISVLATYF
jgi:HrpA-like RNA helicase